MFKYVSDVSILSHNIIKVYNPEIDVAIDSTLGNGYDCDFLSENFKKVYAFEIQKDACDKYIDKNNNVIVNQTTSNKTEPSITNQATSVGTRTHTVGANDTLWGIAKKYYGDGSKWSTIWNANKPMKSGNPNIIYRGEIVKIP